MQQPDAYLDVAQVTLYVFWIFFACLIFYLRREDKREGYPLESTALGGGIVHGFPRMPDLKSYLLSNGHVATLPNHKNDRRDVAVAPIARWPGAPMGPTGNPMRDGVGPASWADREDVPELNIDKVPCIVPLRIAEGTYLESRDPDPRGMRVMGADSEPGGIVTDVWVDRAEALIRYLEVEVVAAAAGGASVGVASGKRVLLPMPFAKIDGRRGRVCVNAILGSQFADVPVTASPDQVTKREEDRIVGYYGGGTLYATPARQEPLL
jgi:photosynthetic reaction center H subunit